MNKEIPKLAERYPKVFRPKGNFKFCTWFEFEVGRHTIDFCYDQWTIVEAYETYYHFTGNEREDLDIDDEMGEALFFHALNKAQREAA